MGLIRRPGSRAPRKPALRIRSSRVCWFGGSSGRGGVQVVIDAIVVVGYNGHEGGRVPISAPSGKGWACSIV